MSLSHLSLVVTITFFRFSTQTGAGEDTEAGKCTDYGSLLDAQVTTTKEMGRILYNIQYKCTIYLIFGPVIHFISQSKVNLITSEEAVKIQVLLL